MHLFFPPVKSSNIKPMLDIMVHWQVYPGLTKFSMQLNYIMHFYLLDITGNKGDVGLFSAKSQASLKSGSSTMLQLIS